MSNTKVLAQQEDKALEAIMSVQGLESETTLEELMAQEDAISEENEIDDLLGSLDDLDDQVSDSSEKVQASEADEDAALDALDLSIIREEAYKEQSKRAKPDNLSVAPTEEAELVETVEPVEAVEPTIEAEPAEPVEEAKIAKPLLEKRVVKRTSTASMLKSEALVHKLGEDRYEICVFTETEAAFSDEDRTALVDKFVESVDRVPKKVGEKIINILSHVRNSTVPLSRYTRIALDHLKAEQTISTSSLRNVYLDRGYKIGTAGAQASQMMGLFFELRIADRKGKALVMRTDSILAQIIE